MRWLVLILAGIAASLAIAQDKDKIAAVDRLLKQLSDPDHKTRLKAVEALGAMGTDAKKAGYVLCQIASYDFSPEVCKAGGVAFAKLRPDLAAPVDQLMNGDDAKEMVAAAEKIGKIGAEGLAATPALIMGIYRQERRSLGDSPVVAACIRALGEVLPSDKNVTGQVGQAAALNGNAAIREAAVQTLAKIGVAHPDQRNDVIAYLQIAMRGKAAEVRVAAIQALASLGPDANAALPTIRRALKDESADVQKAATAAIAAIDKKD